MLPRVEKSVPKLHTVDDSGALYSAEEFYSDGTLGHYAQPPTLRLEDGDGVPSTRMVTSLEQNTAP